MECMICGGDAAVRIGIEHDDDLVLCVRHWKMLRYQVVTDNYASVGFGM